MAIQPTIQKGRIADVAIQKACVLPPTNVSSEFIGPVHRLRYKLTICEYGDDPAGFFVDLHFDDRLALQIQAASDTIDFEA